MKPGEVREDFDRIASLPNEGWDHNAHYHGFLVGHLPPHLHTALDVGCGSGAFTRLLAGRSDRVIGIDLSPGMVEAAQVQSRDFPNISYKVADVMTWDGHDGMFDCVTSIATLHHLPMEEALRKMRSLLRPGGTLLVLDLLQGDGVRDMALGMIALPVSVVLRLTKTGRFRTPRAVRDAWEAHGRNDIYPTFREVCAICERVLPGARVKRHLLWRYSVVWRSADASYTDISTMD